MSRSCPVSECGRAGSPAGHMFRPDGVVPACRCSVAVPLQTGPEIFNRDLVHTRSTLVRGHLAVRQDQVVLAVDLIHQAVPFSGSNAVGIQRGQHRIRPDTRFRPRPAGEVVSGKSTPRSTRRRRCDSFRLVFQSLCPSSINLPVPLCSTGVTPRHSSDGHSDSRRGDRHSVRGPLGEAASETIRSTDSQRVSLPDVPDLPVVPPPTTPRRLRIDLFPPEQTICCLDVPVCRARWHPELRLFPSRLAATTGRIEFVFLRTSRSPSVALHPLSQARSYCQLMGADPPMTGLSPI